RAGSAMLSPEFLVKRRRRRKRRADFSRNASKRRLVRCSLLQLIKEFACSSSLIDVPWNASCQSCESDCTQTSCLASTTISTRFVHSWPIIFRERILSSMFQWHPLVRRFNFVLGNCCVQFQRAK